MKVEIEYREEKTPEVKTFITADRDLIAKMKKHQYDEDWTEYFKSEILKIEKGHEIAIVSVRYCRDGMTKWARIRQ